MKCPQYDITKHTQVYLVCSTLRYHVSIRNLLLLRNFTVKPLATVFETPIQILRGAAETNPQLVDDGLDVYASGRTINWLRTFYCRHKTYINMVDTIVDMCFHCILHIEYFIISTFDRLKTKFILFIWTNETEMCQFQRLSYAGLNIDTISIHTYRMLHIQLSTSSWNTKSKMSCVRRWPLKSVHSNIENVSHCYFASNELTENKHRWLYFSTKMCCHRIGSFVLDTIYQSSAGMV